MDAPDATARRFGGALRGAAVGGLAAFVAILALEHLLAAGLSPLRHEISEYANARDGALMTVGFGAWAVSLAATAALARGRPPLALLALAALGILLVACFATQTSAGRLPAGVHRSLAGRLHDVGSALATLCLLAAAVASVARRSLPRAFRIAAAATLLSAVATAAALLAAGDPAPGIRQRVLVIAGCAWQALLLWALAGVARVRGAGAQPADDVTEGSSADDATVQLRSMSR